MNPILSPPPPVVRPRGPARPLAVVVARMTGLTPPAPLTEELLLDQLVTEDDEPVDNFPSAKQQRLLVETLYSSWAGPGLELPFLADANVGIFASLQTPPLVPDVFLSLGVQVAQDWWNKRHRTYLVPEFGKVPEVVIEIVSNQKGDEDQRKLREYARLGIPYYVIWDPVEQLHQGILRLYELRQGNYVELTQHWLPAVGLGLTVWQGTYENLEQQWLRWCDRDGQLLLTGKEQAVRQAQRADQERQRADQERQDKQLVSVQLEEERWRMKQERHRAEQEYQRAEQERQRAEQERQRAEQEYQRAEQERLQKERLLAQLRALGIDVEV